MGRVESEGKQIWDSGSTTHEVSSPPTQKPKKLDAYSNAENFTGPW